MRYVFHYYGESYAQYFFAGILFYGIYEGIRSYWNYVGLTICYIVALFQVLDQGSFFQLQGSEVALNPIVLMLSITLFFGLLMLISLRKIPNDLFTIHWKNSRKVFITLGAMTYPLYLLHSELIHLTVSTLQKKGDPSYIAIPVTLIIVFSCAYFVNKLDFHIHKLWKHLPLFKKIVEKNSPLLFEKLRKIL